MQENIVKKIKESPKKPGVYTFKKGGQILYIGKASDLRSRLRSYLKITDLKTKTIHEEATGLNYTKLSSPIEALIEESRLIKELEPKLNVYWRDDKNYFYVAFTKDKFPRIYVTHQPGSENSVVKSRPKGGRISTTWQPPSHHLGPFTDGKALRYILRILRRHFPYCTCKEDHLRDCLNSQIGLCPSYCCIKSHTSSDRKIADFKTYQKNIKTIQQILSGKRKKTLQKITTPADLWAVQSILDHSNYLTPILENQAAEGYKKIECYDISNFAGKEAVGAMTVLIKKEGKWEADKNQFRKFRIRQTTTRDDPKMIQEILSRRLNHPEWPYPDLIVIDGGITQYNTAKKVLEKCGFQGPSEASPEQSRRRRPRRRISLISFAKPKKQIIGLSNLKPQEQKAISELLKERIIEKAIDQTHRFVINYHRQLRDKIRA